LPLSGSALGGALGTSNDFASNGADVFPTVASKSSSGAASCGVGSIAEISIRSNFSWGCRYNFLTSGLASTSPETVRVREIIRWTVSENSGKAFIWVRKYGRGAIPGNSAAVDQSFIWATVSARVSGEVRGLRRIPATTDQIVSGALLKELGGRAAWFAWDL
jgi:hypothetical protein